MSEINERRCLQKTNRSAVSSPKVTVVTPTYNRADFLPETIESILSQSFQDFEYFVIDDGSTDNTREVVERYGDRVQYLYHANRGEAASTNRGWSLARGKYFAMVSSDDPMLPDWLEKAVRHMDAQQDVIVGYPDWYMIDLNSKRIQTMIVHEFSLDVLFGWLYCMAGPGTVIRKAALRDVVELRSSEYKYVSDLGSWMNLATKGRFARIPHVLATWRNHPESTSIADKSLRRARETVRLVKAFFGRNDLPAEIQAFKRSCKSRSYFHAFVAVIDSFPLMAGYFYLRSWLLARTEMNSIPAELRRPTFEGMLSVVKLRIEQKKKGEAV